jgi:hypothetical protein
MLNLSTRGRDQDLELLPLTQLPAVADAAAVLAVLEVAVDFSFTYALRYEYHLKGFSPFA